MSFRKLLLTLFLIFVVFPTLLVILGGGALFWFAQKKVMPTFENLTKEISNNNLFPASLQNLKLIPATTSKEHEKGLSDLFELKDADGMIFLFDKKEKRIFWNKNTHLDLILFWISDKNIVGMDYLPSIEKTKEIKMISSPESVDSVVEYVIKKDDDFFIFSPLKNISLPLKIKGLARNDWFSEGPMFLSILDENKKVISQKKIFSQEKDPDFTLFEIEIEDLSFPIKFLKFENLKKTKEKMIKISLSLENSP